MGKILIQLHWQNRSNPDQTELVAQKEFNSEDNDIIGWVTELIERRGNEMPEGWTPLTCNEYSKHFIWAAPHQSNKGKNP